MFHSKYFASSKFVHPKSFSGRRHETEVGIAKSFEWRRLRGIWKPLWSQIYGPDRSPTEKTASPGAAISKGSVKDCGDVLMRFSHQNLPPPPNTTTNIYTKSWLFQKSPHQKIKCVVPSSLQFEFFGPPRHFSAAGLRLFDNHRLKTN